MIHTGDAIEVMRGMEAASVDAVVTDPPYGLEFMGKAWDGPALWDGRARTDDASPGYIHPVKGKAGNWRNAPSYRAGVGFQAWCTEWATEALRVTKPGGYLLAFGGTRTHHRLVCGLEDAGWIIRDELDWIYASGFPKGRANLKPAHEPIVLARKPGPLRPLNIEECRIGVGEWVTGGGNGRASKVEPHNAGRWPSNLLLSDPELFDEPNPYVVGSGATTTVTGFRADPEQSNGGPLFGWDKPGPRTEYPGDSGSYSRFFIIPKADRTDREPVLRGQLEERPTDIGDARPSGEFNDRLKGTLTRHRENAHPTVKPVDLMRHLIRLVTPPGGTILDPFLGSGSTAIAAELEGFPWIGIEKEPEYVAIAEARLNGTQRGLGLDVGAPTKAPPKTHPDLSKHWPKHGGSGPGSWIRPGQTGLGDEEPAA